MREDSLELPVNTKLEGRYKIIRVLGAGGFGITYEAWDELNKIKCAIKEFAPMGIAVRSDENQMVPITNDKRQIYDHGRKRFLEEAEILKQLQGISTVVTITDYFNANGTSYFVMEYLDGVTLKMLVRQMGGRIPYEQALPVLYELGMALKEVHMRGNIFHRDISPENIIITAQGQVKLIDFGNAKFIMNHNEQSLSVVLKPGFAPFEQYSSKGKQGCYTDVYSLAGTFYYVLSGQMLPHAPERVAGTPYVRLRDMGLGIPEYISDAFDCALEVHAINRTQTMEAFLQDLRLIKKSEPMKEQMQAVTDSVAAPTWKPYLDVIYMNKQAQRYLLPINVPVVVGRSQQHAQIVLVGDTCISKRQFEIFYDSIEQSFYIQDHSTNGTFIDGERLEKEKIYLLAEQQVIWVGNQIISLKAGKIYE